MNDDTSSASVGGTVKRSLKNGEESLQASTSGSGLYGPDSKTPETRNFSAEDESDRERYREDQQHDNGEAEKEEDFPYDANGPAEKEASRVRKLRNTKPRMRPGKETEHDSRYMGEMYGSSAFKLQADRLLSKVKLKYGKLEVPAENALRILKTTIESIPAREPMPVRKRSPSRAMASSAHRC